MLRVFALALILGGCSGARKMNVPAGVPVRSVGIALKLVAPIGFPISPGRVFFAKLDERGTPSRDIIPSNYSRGDRFYLFDVDAGTYAAVAALAEVNDSIFLTFFSRELVERTRVAVSAHELAFMGRYSVYSNPIFAGLDTVQEYYAKAITPDFGKLLNLIIGPSRYRGAMLKARTSEKDRVKFMEVAPSDLAAFAEGPAAKALRVPEQDPRLEGMTTNERLVATGLMPEFEQAMMTRNRDAMIGVLVRVRLTPQEAAKASDAILADPAKFGYGKSSASKP